MADVVNRATKQYIRSVNTPDFPIADWIHNPDLSAVVGQPPKYWDIVLDLITLMSATDRQAVEDAKLVATRDTRVSQIDHEEDLLRAIVSILLDEINILRQDHGLAPRTLAQARRAIRNKLGQ